jgi:hypothetical protein
VEDHKFLKSSHSVLSSLLESIIQFSSLELGYKLLVINLAILVCVYSQHELVYLSRS